MSSVVSDSVWVEGRFLYSVPALATLWTGPHPHCIPLYPLCTKLCSPPLLCTGSWPCIPLVQGPGPSLHVQTCSTWTLLYRDLTSSPILPFAPCLYPPPPPPPPPRPDAPLPAHTPDTFLLWRTEWRKAGVWHSTEMPSCFRCVQYGRSSHEWYSAINWTTKISPNSGYINLFYNCDNLLNSTTQNRLKPYRITNGKLIISYFYVLQWQKSGLFWTW